jgi:hypothetical protein
VNPATAALPVEPTSNDSQPVTSPNAPTTDSRGRDNRQRDRDLR